VVSEAVEGGRRGFVRGVRGGGRRGLMLGAVLPWRWLRTLVLGGRVLQVSERR
jgi:hypothetical protein